MDEYIERETVYRAFSNDDALSGYEKAYCRKIIKKIPAADVATVQHGRWVHDHYENCSEQFEIVKCTNCGHKAYAMAIYVRGGNYCPNCGAKMDGEEHNG